MLQWMRAWAQRQASWTRRVQKARDNRDELGGFVDASGWGRRVAGSEPFAKTRNFLHALTGRRPAVTVGVQSLIGGHSDSIDPVV